MTLTQRRAAIVRSSSQVIAREPAITVGAITAAVGATLVLLFAFVAGFTAEQQTAVVAFATAVVPLVAAVITRTRVSPVATGAAGREPAQAAGLGY